MGEQHRYTFRAILSENDVIIDTLSTKIGLRSIRLVREPDSTGTSFYFEVNGQPVFAKGANYIPNDNFLPRVTNNKYEQLIRSATKDDAAISPIKDPDHRIPKSRAMTVVDYTVIFILCPIKIGQGLRY